MGRVCVLGPAAYLGAQERMCDEISGTADLEPILDLGTFVIGQLIRNNTEAIIADWRFHAIACIDHHPGSEPSQSEKSDAGKPD